MLEAHGVVTNNIRQIKRLKTCVTRQKVRALTYQLHTYLAQ